MKKLTAVLLILILCVQTFVPSSKIFASSVDVEGLDLILLTNTSNVNSGEEFSYRIQYSASSTIDNYANSSISLALPEGVTYTDHTDSAITTSTVQLSNLSGQTEVTFQFNNGNVPAGATGELVVKGKFENYTTPEGTMATTKAIFNAEKDSAPVSMVSNDVTVTSQASANWLIEMRSIAPIVTPFKGGDVQYEIEMQPVIGNGLGLVDIEDVSVTVILEEEAVFVSADNGGRPGPDNTVVWELADYIRDTETLKFTVNYPSSMTKDQATTSAVMEATPLGGSPIIYSAEVTHGFELQPIDFGTTLNFTTNDPEISPGQNISVELSGLNNRSNSQLENSVLEIMTPAQTEAGTPVNLGLQSVTTAVFSGISSYDIYYTLVEAPQEGDWTIWCNVGASTSQVLDAKSIGTVKGIQFRFGTVPIEIRQERNFGFKYKVNYDFPSSNTKEVIRTVANFNYYFDGAPKTSSSHSETSIVRDRPLLELQHSVSKTSAAPADIVTYTLSVSNDGARSSAKLENPVIYTILPAALEYVQGSWSISKPAILAFDPLFTAVSLPSGETKLMWSWDDSYPGNLSLGETVQIRINAKIKPGTPAQTVINTFGVQSPTYLNDVNYTYPTPADGVYTVQATSSMIVNSSASLESKTWVKGELDSDWSDTTGITTPGGQALYKLEVQNIGNVPMKQLSIVNPFPRIGDTAVLNNNVSRSSDWGPVLTEEVVAPSYVTVYYSTTPGITMNSITGNDNGVWTEFLPDDPTSVTAIKLEFDSDFVIDPLDKFTFEWAMRTPVGAPTGGEMAWNSYAYKVNTVSGQTLLPAEPNKVGISIIGSNKASIGDYVWLDQNENGIQDAGETGINGVRVELYDHSGTKLATTVTSNDFDGNSGSYLFPNLDPGQYQVSFALPSVEYGYTRQNQGSDMNRNSDVNPVTGKTELLSLSEEEVNRSIDAGMFILTNADAPTIDTEPTDQIVNVGAIASLSVEASTPSGTLSYQWYSNTTNSTSGGTLITGEISDTYTPPTTTTGSMYYYVIVTNTDISKTGTKTESVTSNVVQVQVLTAPAYTVSALATSTTPGAGVDNAITLTVLDSSGNTDTAFSGVHNVTISGYTQAPDNSYGSLNGTEITSAATTTNSVTFTSGVATVNLSLNKAALQTISFSVADVNAPDANTVSITPEAGIAASMVLTTNITGPVSNGAIFAQQPVVVLLDAYGNTSTGDSSTEVTVSKKDAGNWTLTGTVKATASAGIVTFTNLGATNTVEVTGAQLAFDASNLNQVTSQQVILPQSVPVPTTPTTPTTPTRPSEPSTPEDSPVSTVPTIDIYNRSIVNEANLIQKFASKVEEAKGESAQFYFSDTQGHWAEQTIDIFVQLKLINGYPDDTFRPNNPITRAEFAIILNRVLEIQGGNTSKVLKDIDDTWAEDVIENLVAAGILTGYPDDTFRPNQTITREEMVVILSRIVNLSELEKDSTKGQFNDLNGAYAGEKIMAAAQAGIVSGKGEGSFDPKSSTTRAEALQIILNVLKLKSELKTLLESLN